MAVSNLSKYEEDSTTEVSFTEGLIKVEPANLSIQKAMDKENPTDLFNGLLYEGDLTCLFADSNVGKTIFAVQMAAEISKDRKVLYLDCELSDKQMQMRYTNPDTGKVYEFPKNFYRATINPEGISEGDYETQLLNCIEKAAVYLGAKAIVIDNLTWVCGDSERGEDAALFMKKLMHLKFKYGWLILVIAHTPKHREWEPISTNHLAGSKKLFNFFDTVITMGKCAYDKNKRYVKQLKVRNGQFKYDDSNVLVYNICSRDDGFLWFEKESRNSTEYQMISQQGIQIQEIPIYNNLMEMRQEGNTIREIARMAGLSKSRVGEILKGVPVPKAIETGQADSEDEFEIGSVFESEE